MVIELQGLLDRSRNERGKRKAEAALKEIGGEPLEGSGFENEVFAAQSS